LTTKTTKILSVIIVTYQAEKFIEAAILSVINLIPKDDLELIIVDGLSKDKTVSIIQNYLPHIDYFVSEQDKGIYDAMNKGIRVATGKFIYFLGADDKWIGDYNSIKSKFKLKNTVYYGNVILNPTNKIYDGEFNLFKFMNRNICHQSIFYPQEVFKKYTYDVRYSMMADFVLNIKIWNDDEFNFKYIPDVVASYNIEGSSTNTLDRNFQRDAFKLVYSNFGILGVIIKVLNPIRNFFYNKYEK
jgi:glycosyltransferase involved in cell wall biosynthesis